MLLAAGTRIGHFEILGLLGIGGMGEVYRARDIRLSRDVALKVLPQHFNLDGDRRSRFEREARLLASLNHPNIATLHSIEDSGSRPALVMELVEGENLDDLIGLRASASQRGLPVVEATRIARQVVDALESAHARAIVHRDLKPSNIKVRPDGTVKVLDFGIAKVFETEQGGASTAATMTVAEGGAMVGTPAYMSPEQARGLPVDARADIWAFGCVLYEMLTGRRAFQADTTSEILAKVLEREPDFAVLPPDLPPSLARLLQRCLQKAPENRLRHIADARFELQEAADLATYDRGAQSDHVERGGPQPEQAEPAGVRKTMFRWTAGTIGAATILAAVAAASMWNASRNETWAKREAIPEVERLVGEGKFPEAFTLATQAAQYAPDDPMLRSLKPQYAMTMKVTSTPEGADVYVRGYEAVEAEWQHLGRTPLENVVLPRRALRWRFQKAEFSRAERATTDQADILGGEKQRGVLDVRLQTLLAQPREMVWIPGGPSSRNLNGAALASVTLPPYLLDRHEVTNREYKEFVNSGGYSDSRFWEGLDFRKDGKPLPWREAVNGFVDTTSGMPGPATWELGDYPAGQDDFPVGGVSWFEAMAYARFRGKMLPTVFHWTHASVPNSERGSGLSPSIVALSNNEGKGPAAAGSYQGAGPFGTFDMAGNVREWCFNGEIGTDGRAMLGGSWKDAEYVFHLVAFPSSFDRSPINGIRLMREIGAGPDQARQPMELLGRTYEGVTPVSDAVFDGYKEFLAYTPDDVEVIGERTIEKPGQPAQGDWSKKRVELEASNGDRLVLYVFLPRHITPPYQKAVYFPPNPILDRKESSSEAVEPGFAAMPLDFVIKSGRALIYPVYEGSYERWRELKQNTPFPFESRVRQWRTDVGRALDYLDQDGDFRGTPTAYIGTSLGATLPLAILAVETRFAAAVLLSGGLPQSPMPARVDPINFAPHITLPVLMLNGKLDYLLPKARYQDPLFERLGTSRAKKKHHTIETAGHGFFPRHELVSHTVRWLDTHLGPVGASSSKR